MKIKKITILLSILGVASSVFSQSSNIVYKLTDDPNDGLTVQTDPFEKGMLVTESEFGSVKNYVGSELEELTGVTGLTAGDYVLIDAKYTYNPDTGFDEYVAGSATLEPVEDLGLFVGPPAVKNVRAEQIPGTKKVRIEYFQQYDTSKPDVFIEVWFRKSPDSIQWMRCMELATGGGSALINLVPKMNDANEIVAHTSNVSSNFMNIEWDAGAEQPDFKEDNCTIRVMAVYEKTDSGGGYIPMEQQGSGWDGYEADKGAMFDLDDTAPMLPWSDSMEVFFGYIDGEQIPRVGSYDQTGHFYPVYNLTSTMLKDLTDIEGIPNGNYAFGMAAISPDVAETLHIIPVKTHNSGS